MPRKPTRVSGGSPRRRRRRRSSGGGGGGGSSSSRSSGSSSVVESGRSCRARAESHPTLVLLKMIFFLPGSWEPHIQHQAGSPP